MPVATPPSVAPQQYPSLAAAIAALQHKADSASLDFLEPIHKLIEELLRIEEDLRHLERLENYQTKLFQPKK